MILDIAVIIVLLLSGIIAFLRGFIRETLTILGVVGGLLAAYVGGPLLSPFVRGWVSPETAEGVADPGKFMDVIPYPMLADGLAYGGLFLVVVIALSIFSHILSASAKSIGAGAIDRSFGFIFGLVRGVILLALLYLPFYLLLDQTAKDKWFGESRLHFYLEKSSGFVAGFLPDSSLTPEPKKTPAQPSTRERLQEMDLLKKTKDELEGAYDAGFRKEMDKLFDQTQDELLNE